MKNVIKGAKGSLNNIFQDSFNKISFHRLTHDRSICYILVCLTRYLALEGSDNDLMTHRK